MSMTKQRLDGIQALRGVAALAVLLHHAMEVSGGHGWLTRLGASGVDVFFVISGFVMAYTSKGLSAPTFLLRRIARVVPMYWLVNLAMLGVAATGLAYKNLNTAPPYVIASLLFLEPAPMLNIGWTLNLEMVFYLLFAATIAVGLFRFAALVIPLLLLLGIATGLPQISKPIVLEFAMGVGLGTAFARGWLSGKFAAPAALLSIGLFAAASYFSPDPATAGLPETVRWVWWGVPALLMVYASLYWKPRSTLLGDASYSIYLVHPIVMTALAKVLLETQTPLWLAFPAAIVISLGLGLLAYRVAEGPLHRFTSAYFRPRRRTGETADARPA